MATSGSYDNTTTMSNILYDAFALINVHDDSETLPADMWDYGKRKLNQVMSLLSTRKSTWLVDQVTVTLTPGTESYTVGVGETIDNPKPLQVSDAWRVTSDGYDIPIMVVSRDEYMSMSNKSLQAPATMVYYDPRRDTGTLYVWPTGTTTENSIIIDAQRPIQDFDAEGNNPDLPKEWVLYITHLLATFLAPKYIGGVPASLQTQTDRIAISLSIFDEEKVSVYVQPK